MRKTIRAALISAGVKNLREYGYPEVDDKNILTDPIYSRFFLSMLSDNKGKGFNEEIASLEAEIAK